MDCQMCSSMKSMYATEMQETIAIKQYSRATFRTRGSISPAQPVLSTASFLSTFFALSRVAVVEARYRIAAQLRRLAV